YIVIPAFIGAAFLLLSALIPNHTLQFAFLCVAAAGIFAPQPVFWSLPSRFLKGTTFWATKPPRFPTELMAARPAA
ncbi:hypothetical protein ACC754_45100, partial [Rhizobium johnstonii]